MLLDINSLFNNNKLIIENSTFLCSNDTHQCFLSLIKNESNKKAEIVLICTLINTNKFWHKIKIIASYLFRQNRVAYAPFLLSVSEAQNILNTIEEYTVYCKNQDNSKKGTFLTRKEAYKSCMKTLLEMEKQRIQNANTDCTNDDSE